jgi:hypothetical protein
VAGTEETEGAIWDEETVVRETNVDVDVVKTFLEELVETERIVDEEVLLDELVVEIVILEELVEVDLAKADAVRAATFRTEGRNMTRYLPGLVVLGIDIKTGTYRRSYISGIL